MNFDERLNLFLDKDQILKDEPMKKHTSFKIGGNADYFIIVKTEEELIKLVNECKKSDKNFFVLGNGSNLLVTDKGFRGVIIKVKINNINIIDNVDSCYITVGAGYSLIRLSNIALENSLEGLEFASGIPGTVGGAVRMNAGAYGGEIKDVVISTKYYDVNDNTIKTMNLNEHEFSYRNSAFSKENYIILETTVKLKKGDKEVIKNKMDENNKSRLEKQPLDYPSAGSTFKRLEGVITAKLLDEAGLKGYSVGGAEVSTKHAGFLINKNNATFDDMMKLIEYIQKTIFERNNIKLELEVLIIGER